MGVALGTQHGSSSDACRVLRPGHGAPAQGRERRDVWLITTHQVPQGNEGSTARATFSLHPLSSSSCLCCQPSSEHQTPDGTVRTAHKLQEQQKAGPSRLAWAGLGDPAFLLQDPVVGNTLPKSSEVHLRLHCPRSSLPALGDACMKGRKTAQGGTHVHRHGADLVCSQMQSWKFSATCASQKHLKMPAPEPLPASHFSCGWQSSALGLRAEVC